MAPTALLASNQNLISAAIAIAVTVYFWRVNIKGIHESSDQALKIMGATTVMGVIMIVWCWPPWRSIPTSSTPAAARRPTSTSKVDPVTREPMLDPLGKQVDPLGFLGRRRRWDTQLRPESMTGNWFSLLGVIGHADRRSATRSWR